MRWNVDTVEQPVKVLVDWLSLLFIFKEAIEFWQIFRQDKTEIEIELRRRQKVLDEIQMPHSLEERMMHFFFFFIIFSE